MFLLTALVYPVVLGVLTLGCGLLVDRLTGGFLAASLLPAVGVAGLIAISQLSTYLPHTAPLTPYAMCIACAAGVWLGRRRLVTMARRWRHGTSRIAALIIVYGLACAPVLLAGRATFSSYMALADSAVHMLGADFLIRHGQHYAHLDLRNSYGQFVNNYYNMSYPSGADTLLGGSAFLLGLPLIWAFQPFCAFMLASCTGALWEISGRFGLRGGLRLAATVCAALPALVYAYELIGSIKELTAASMALALGALVVHHRRWLYGPVRGGIVFALLGAAGISALGAGFGAWVLAALVVLCALLAVDAGREPQRALRSLALAGVAAGTALVCALPTWVGLSGSLRVAQGIASTNNPGNLQRPLRALQGLGVWLSGSYKLSPSGVGLTLTDTLIALAVLAAVLGAWWVLRDGEYALAGWLSLMLVVWLSLSAYSTTWVEAKTLMITSPVLALLAWGGVAALHDRVRPLGALLGLLLAGGVLASDAMQYHQSDLAPTARYEELRRIDRIFAGKGPVLFTDFDEYSMYELHDLDVAGPDFAYPPPALASASGGYGKPVDLELVTPRTLREYPLIVTRRDPGAPRPAGAYSLAWEGSYYEVWRRLPGAPVAIFHRPLHGTPASQCAQIGRLIGGVRSGRLLAAEEPPVVEVALAGSRHPDGWGHERRALVMGSAGSLRARFELPSVGLWQLWVFGQFMPRIEVSVDGRALGTISGELDGNSLVFNAPPPFTSHLAAGTHVLSLSRSGFSLAPGAGGSAVLDRVLLSPEQNQLSARLASIPASHWRSLCGPRYQWVELVR